MNKDRQWNGQEKKLTNRETLNYCPQDRIQKTQDWATRTISLLRTNVKNGNSDLISLRSHKHSTTNSNCPREEIYLKTKWNT